MRPSFRRVFCALGALFLFSAAGPDGFWGCGEESGDDPLPIGHAPPPECVVDMDCMGGGSVCMQYRCLEGRCITGGMVMDADHDGEFPVPCGADCNDGNREVYSGAPETCDARDNDCDSRIDENATGTVAPIVVTGADFPSQILPWGDALAATRVVTDTSGGSFLYLALISPEGVQGAIVGALELGNTISEIEAYPSMDGTIGLVWHTSTQVSAGVIRYRSPTAVEVVTDSTVLYTVGRDELVEDVAITHFAGEYWVSYQTELSDDRTRFTRRIGNATPMISTQMPASGMQIPMQIASTGMYLATIEGPQRIGLYGADGALVDSVDLPSIMIAKPFVSVPDGLGVVRLASSTLTIDVLAPDGSPAGSHSTPTTGAITDRAASAGDYFVVSHPSGVTTTILQIFSNAMFTSELSPIYAGNVPDLKLLSATTLAGAPAILAAGEQVGDLYIVRCGL